MSTDFDLQSVLDQIMNGGGDEQLGGPHNVDAVAGQCAQGGRPGNGSARTNAAKGQTPQADQLPELPGDALPTMTAPADTTVVTGDEDASMAANQHPMVAFPQFTNESIAAQLDIRNFATLCRLKVRKWVGRKRDKGAAKKAESDHGSVDGTYTAYKKLFAGTEDKLKAVNSVLDSARTRHYQMTLPWSTTGMDDSGRRDGPRLLANTLFMEYTTEMAHAKQLVLTKLGELRAAYPELLIEAKRNLGEAFVVTDYPTPDELEHMFALDFEFSPIPDGMDFKGLPAQQASKLADALTQARNKCLEGAMQDVWRRLHGVVSKMADRLSDPKHTFHDTLVTNVRETVDLLTHLNATSDATIESIRQRVEKDLCRHNPEVLRNDLRKRKLTAMLAGHILADMDSASATSSSKKIR